MKENSKRNNKEGKDINMSIWTLSKVLPSAGVTVSILGIIIAVVSTFQYYSTATSDRYQELERILSQTIHQDAQLRESQLRLELLTTRLREVQDSNSRLYLLATSTNLKPNGESQKEILAIGALGDDVDQLKKYVASLGNDIEAIRNIIRDNPEKALSIVMMRKDIDNVKDRMDETSKSLERQMTILLSIVTAIGGGLVVAVVSKLFFGEKQK